METAVETAVKTAVEKMAQLEVEVTAPASADCLLARGIHSCGFSAADV